MNSGMCANILVYVPTETHQTMLKFCECVDAYMYTK